MIKIEKLPEGFQFVDEKGEQTIPEIFEEIHRTKDIEGYFIGKNIWGEYLLISGEGNLVYMFPTNQKPKGVYSLIDAIAKNVDIVKKIHALEFFADKGVKDVLKVKHEQLSNKEILDAEKKGDFVRASGIVVMYDLEKAYLDSVFEKNERRYKNQKNIEKNKERLKERAVRMDKKTKENIR